MHGYLLASTADVVSRRRSLDPPLVDKFQKVVSVVLKSRRCANEMRDSHTCKTV
jgi:hypothetical protein